MASRFLAQVATLAGGTAMAQAVNLVTLPVLTRLYSPADFGVLAVFLAVVSVGSVLASLQYENAIMAAPTDEDARRCVALVFWLSGVISLAAAFVAGVAWVVDGTSGKLPDGFLVIAVASAAMLAATAWTQALYAFGNRTSQYGFLTRGRVFGALVTGGVAIAWGYLLDGFEGLLIGTLLGSLTNTAYLWVRSGQFDLAWLRASRHQLLEVARQNIRFPKFLIFSSLLDRASSQLHIFVLTRWFDAAIAGSVSLHNRVVSLPSSLIGNAIGDVFKQKASEALRENGNCRRLFVRTTAVLALVAIVPFVVLLLFAPPLFAMVFGEQWRMAGEISQRLAIVFALGFVVSPVSALIYLEENQKYDLVVQGLLMGLLIAGFAWAVSRQDAMAAIVVYAVAYSVKYVVELYLCACIATGRSWTLRPLAARAGSRPETPS